LGARRLTAAWARVVFGPGGAAFVVYTLLAIVLWLPFGFRMNGLVEEWDISWLLDRGEQLWWITRSSTIAYLRLRPLTMTPFAMAHALGGFMWLNVIAVAIFALRGTATFLLVDRILPGRRPAAWTAGALAMLYPANTGLFALRMTHINLAVTLFLFALVLLCDLGRDSPWWRVVPMSLLLAGSLLIYQIALLAAVVGPAVLLVLGVRDWRRLAALAAAWYAGLAAVTVYWLVVISQGGTYELNSASGPRPSVRIYAHDLIQAYLDQTTGAWSPDPWVTWRPAFIGIGIGCGIAIAALGWASGRSSERSLRERRTLLAGVGLVVLSPIGFLPLWAIVASIRETLKVYLLSSVAVAAGIALLIAFLGRRIEIVAVCSGAFVAVGVIYGLHQHAYYTARAHGEERILGEMVDQLPSPPKGTTIVVRDRTGHLASGTNWTLGPPVTFGAAVSVAYHDPTLSVALCEELVQAAYVNGIPVSRCPDKPIQPGSPARIAVFDYDLLHELRLVTSQKGLPAGYDPRKLANRGPDMRRSLFSCAPIQKCTDAPSASWPRGSIHELFDEFALNVTGIRGVEKPPTGPVFQWSNSPVVDVFAVLPSQAMRFDLHVVYVIDPSVLKTIRVSANGHSVPVSVASGADGYHVTGTIPARALAPARDILAIRSKVVPVTGAPEPIGLGITRLDVQPIR
jgi:hypothetical protein